jgi:hypothetical protein
MPWKTSVIMQNPSDLLGKEIDMSAVEHTWEHKVERVVQRLAQAAWRRANHDPRGNPYKRHRQYALPTEAMELVQALGDHDRKAAEIRCKEIMEGLRLARVPIDDVRCLP